MIIHSEDCILVTGGNGFLGKFVVRELFSKGYRNVVPLSGTRDGLDLTDSSHVGYIFQQHSPKIVIHLAARVGGIGANQLSPASFFYENLNMGMKVIEEARMTTADKVILAGTVCSYPKHCPVPFSEDDLWNGYPEETNAPYGIAKKALMEMIRSYRMQFNFNGITLMPVNMYGPEDNFNTKTSHVIPALITNMQKAIEINSKEIVVWGTGNATREFLFVEDCAEAIVRAMEVYDEPDPINIGTGKETRIKDLVEIIADKMGYDGKIIWDTSKPDGQPRRCLNVDKAKAKLGFSAKTDLSTGLERTVKWYKEVYRPSVVGFAEV